MGGSVRDHRAGLTLHGPVLAISAGPGRSWQTGRSLSIDGYALSLCLGFIKGSRALECEALRAARSRCMEHPPTSSLH